MGLFLFEAIVYGPTYCFYLGSWAISRSTASWGTVPHFCRVLSFRKYLNFTLSRPFQCYTRPPDSGTCSMWCNQWNPWPQAPSLPAPENCKLISLFGCYIVLYSVPVDQALCKSPDGCARWRLVGCKCIPKISNLFLCCTFQDGMTSM